MSGYGFAERLVCVCMALLLPAVLWAEEGSNSETPDIAPVVKTDVAADVEAGQAIAPVNTVEDTPAEATQPEAVAEDAPVDEGAGMLAGVKSIVITDRVSIGTLGKDLIAEYGFQIELTSPHFGIVGRWAYLQNYPTTIGFSYDLGFAFHYYPFGEGPSGLYVGPGFNLIHMFRNPDPLPAMVVPKEIEYLVRFYRTGYGHSFDFMTPILEVGYRYRFPFYLTLGVELTAGYAFSDQPRQWESNFFWVFNPQIGFSW